MSYIFVFSEVWSKLTRVAGDGGISLGDKQQFCGDYIFSGHTMVLIIAYLIVKECKFNN